MAESTVDSLQRDLLIGKRLMEGEMWDTAHPQPSQDYGRMTGGISPFASPPDAMLLQMQMIQQNQMLSMHQASQAQAQLQAYARGVPGYLPPSLTLGDPTFANYQMQAMYQMNPYMANFIAGQGGGPTMNLVSPQYMTPSRMGVFRNIPTMAAPQTSGVDSFLRDLATLGWAQRAPVVGRLFGERSYAAYEDILDEQIEASRRMTRRAESIASSAISLLPTAAAFIPGVGIPAAIGLEMGLSPVLGGLTNAYFQRRAETSRIYDITKNIATSAQAGGFRNIGFSMGESAGIMRMMRKEAAASPFYNMADYMQVLEEGTQAGLFKFNANSRTVMDTLKGIIGNIDVFMMLAGDPDVRSAMDRMGKLQQFGVAPSQMQQAITNLKTFSRMAGVSVDDVMNTLGGYGAQLAAQQGALPGFGMTIGGLSQGLTNMMIQRGVFSRPELAMRGGQEGAGQQMTQALLNVNHSAIARNLPAFIRFEGGKPVVDSAALAAYTETGKLPGGFAGTLQEYAMQRAREFTREQLEMISVQSQDLAADAMSKASGPRAQLQMFRNFYKDIKKLDLGEAQTRRILMAQTGFTDKEADYLLGEDADMDLATRELDTMRGIATRRRSKFRASRTLGVRLSTWVNEIINDWTSGLEQTVGAAGIEQSRAMWDSGQAYVPTDSPGWFGDNAFNSLKDLGSPVKDFTPAALSAAMIKRKLTMFAKQLNPQDALGSDRSFRVLYERALQYKEIDEVPEEERRRVTGSQEHWDTLARDIFSKGGAKNKIFHMPAAEAARVIASARELGGEYMEQVAMFHTNMQSAVLAGDDAKVQMAENKYYRAAKALGTSQDDARSLMDFVSQVRSSSATPITKDNVKALVAVSAELIAHGRTNYDNLEEQLPAIFSEGGLEIRPGAVSELVDSVNASGSWGANYHGSKMFASKSIEKGLTAMSTANKAKQAEMTLQFVDPFLEHDEAASVIQNRNQIESIMRRQFAAATGGKGTDKQFAEYAGSTEGQALAKLTGERLEIGNVALDANKHLSGDQYQRGIYNLMVELVRLTKDNQPNTQGTSG